MFHFITTEPIEIMSWEGSALPPLPDFLTYRKYNIIPVEDSCLRMLLRDPPGCCKPSELYNSNYLFLKKKILLAKIFSEILIA